MTTLSARWTQMVASGGRAVQTEYAITIEGVLEAFATTEALDFYHAATPFYGLSGANVCYPGMSREGIEIQERAQWSDAKLEASGFTIRIDDSRTAAGTEKASLVFSGREPAVRTYLTAALTATATTVNVASTAGFASSGTIHIGREAISYTGKTSTSFTTCTRARFSSCALAHRFDSALGFGDEVTDQPQELKGRRCYLYELVDGETGSTGDGTSITDATIVRRGIVQSIRSTADGEGSTGFELGCDHVSSLLDQSFGQAVKPFGLRGYYIPTGHETMFEVYEWAGAAYLGGSRSLSCLVTLSGFYPDAAALVAAATAQLDRVTGNWLDSTGAAGSPANLLYSAEVTADGQLAILFTTASAYPKFVTVSGMDGPAVGGRAATRLPGTHFIGADALPVEASYGGVTTLVATSKTYRITAFDGALPVAWTVLGGLTASGAGTSTPAVYPANRIYVKGEMDAGLVAGVTVAMKPAGETSVPVTFGVQSVDTANHFLTVSVRAFGFSFADTEDAAVEFTVQSDYGTSDLYAFVFALITATPDYSGSGRSPWLPLAEFDTADMQRELLEAGGADYQKTWVLGQESSLSTWVRGDMQALGLCWVTRPDGRLSWRRIRVAGSAIARADISGASHTLPRACPTISRDADGIFNTVIVKGGWDGQNYARADVGAQVQPSHAIYGARILTIEPRSGDLQVRSALGDADARSRIAISLVSVYAWPYSIVTLTGCPGAKLANVMIGDVVTLTDSRMPWRGARGVTSIRGFVVGRTRRPAAHEVDLTLMLSNLNAVGYAPAARCAASTPLGGANLRITMRAETALTEPYADTGSYDYMRLQAGDVVLVEQIDVTSAARETHTIASVDTTNHYLYTVGAVGLSMNTAGTRWVVKYAGYDAAVGAGTPPQHAFAFVAGTDMRIGTADAPASTWGV